MICVPSETIRTIQAALDLAEDGDAVVIAPGEYIITEPLQITKSIHLLCVDEVGNSAVLVFNGGLLRPATPLLRLDAVSCRIKGVHLVYNHNVELAAESAVARACAVVVGKGSATLDECRIESSCGGVRVLEGAYGTLLCVKVTSGTTAIDVEGRLFADRCDVLDSRVGIHINVVAEAQVKTCCFRQCHTAFLIKGQGFGKLDSNMIVQGSVGIHLDLPLFPRRLSVIQGNEFSLQATASIVVTGAQPACDISKNYFHNVTGAGVVLDASSQYVQVKGNAFKNCTVGVRITGGASASIEGNVIEESSDAAIVIISSRPTCRLNEIIRSNVGVKVTTSSNAHPADVDMHADPHIEGNTFGENQVNLLVVAAGGTFLKNNLLQAFKENIILDSVAPINSILSGNAICGSMSSSCIVIMGGAIGRFTYNVISGAKLSGILLDGSGFSEIESNTFRGCQCAVTATGQAAGSIKENTLNDLTIEIYSDSRHSILNYQN